MNIYLAGPFFNEVQIAYAEKLAKYCKDLGHSVYAPVFEKWDECDGALTAKEVFERNVSWMKVSEIVFAQLDYPMVFGNRLVLESTTERQKVVLPDAGTVWEMGYAYALNIPVIGYYMHKPKKINLMLAFACKGITKDIFKVVNKNGIFWELIEEWKGNLS